MREYTITLTTRIEAASAEQAKQLLQKNLPVGPLFQLWVSFDAIKGAMYCEGCGSEITGVRWSERYHGIESVKLDGAVCCSEDEGEFPTEESAAHSIDFINKRLRGKAGLPEAANDEVLNG